MSQARPAELPAAVPRRARLAGIGGWWGWAVAIPALTLAAFLLALRAGQDQVRTGARQRLVIAEAVLRTTVDRYRSLPTVLALDTQVQDLLAAPGASGAAAVNAKFEAIARASGVAAIYLMDARGLTLAASNWNQPLSFVGSSYAYRPYFLDALATGASRYFGIGTTTQQPGLFIGQAVEARGDRQGGGVAGVVVVKVDLEGLEGEWRRAGEQILVSDAAGIVFLASEPGWKYRPFRPLTVPETDRIRTARQYGDSDLRPLLADGPPDPGGTIRLPSAGGAGHGLVEPVAMPDLGWTLWTIAPTGAAWRQGVLVAAATGIAGLALAFALAAASQKRQRLRAEQSMRLSLERRVAERTHDLSEANARLRAEMAERERATTALRATQDELIHAGRLAALGQISTAINHEINQPLAALRTFLASTVLFLERGDQATVRRNLQRMTEVTQRIAEIIRHLKDFARKTGPEHREPVRLASAAEAALDLLRVRLRADGVAVDCRIPPDALVRAEPVRLEQVILNLMVNALDAMRDVPERRLDLCATRETSDGSAPSWRLDVADNGSGIAPEHLGQIFDPFFTTKPAGEGLGLGLSLSSLIVRDLKGSLTAGNGAQGAVLTLVLPAAEA
ncbi:ATP-binding protein [Methylobacterium sp. SyP6R]|uniref:ATP-binding protein n=1 Tax=Methylobacterium sp. SyP6R TaxID=2718876 RepID=UPI001F326FF9|nr:ATP-binding protein [Methylobacterium sp. SyP6R]MCF4124744.1 ATP-binding protein [Methylobacterium sp. SyP6R]